MEKAPWRGEYSVNLMEIDAQHIQFIELSNKFRDSLNSRLTEEDAVRIFEELEAHIEKHFATEEKYFDEFCFEDAAEHSAEHQKAKEKIAQLKEKYTQKKSFIVIIKLLEFMDDWMASHIMDFDKKYEKCFRSNGIK